LYYYDLTAKTGNKKKVKKHLKDIFGTQLTFLLPKFSIF